MTAYLQGRRVHIHEVGLRDGLQMEARIVPTADKVALIDRLGRSGVAMVEAASFVSPRALPAMADAEVVLRAIERVPGAAYTALVPNARGAQRALGCGLDEFNLVMSASAGHGLANLRMTPGQSLAAFGEVVRAVAGTGVALNASLSTAFGCPFDGEVPPARVLELVDRIEQLGVVGVTLCDTTGMANPAQVARLCAQVLRRHPRLRLTLHFHDTRGMGLANVLAAMQEGADRFDASLGGLGGCPYAPGATGNVCTEDLVHMLHAMGCDTGVDLDALLAAARTLAGVIGRELPGAILKAGPWHLRHPLPAGLAA